MRGSDDDGLGSNDMDNLVDELEWLLGGNLRDS
jgi:hypothetical protein